MKKDLSKSSIFPFNWARRVSERDILLASVKKKLINKKLIKIVFCISANEIYK